MKISTISYQNYYEVDFADVLKYKLGVWFRREDIRPENNKLIVTYKCHDYTIQWYRELSDIEDAKNITGVRITSDNNLYANLQVLPEQGIDPDVEDISKVIHKLDDFTCGRIDRTDPIFADR